MIISQHLSGFDNLKVWFHNVTVGFLLTLGISGPAAISARRVGKRISSCPNSGSQLTQQPSYMKIAFKNARCHNSKPEFLLMIFSQVPLECGEPTIQNADLQNRHQDQLFNLTSLIQIISKLMILGEKGIWVKYSVENISYPLKYYIFSNF